MGARRTSVEIDEGLLDEARAILGTATIRETIEEAFRQVARQRARGEEIEALSTLRGMDLADPETMAAAWRE